jgi:isopenicillin N synthase-like dioxygenase
VAEIPTIKLKELEANSEEEGARLFDACRQHGFFLLDLHGSSQGDDLLTDAEHMFDLASETFHLDKTILDQFAYNPPKDLLGYKESGKLKTDDGKLDATELYTLGQDDTLHDDAAVLPRRNPAPIEAHRRECRSFFTHAHTAVTTVLSALDAPLGLPAGTLRALCQQTTPSSTSLRLLLTKPRAALPQRITLGAHTDIGLITLLFNLTGGLQILPASSPSPAEAEAQHWRYIRPSPGCAVMNLGDTLVEWTGGVLRSALHRVVTAPGRQNECERVSLAYLVRPARGQTMRRLRGSGIPVEENGGEGQGRDVDEWAAERAGQIIRGILKPRTHGGIAIST